MKITKDIKYIGVNDRKIDLFEGQYIVPNGMAYNSYLIEDEKIAIMDSVGSDLADEWINNIKTILGEREPDYFIVQHMEPDHSKNMYSIIEAYPNIKIVSSERSFLMMKQFFGLTFSDNAIVVGDGDTICLGTHTLQFITAPMVHWPEVIMSYDEKDKVLFSADAFGKFGAIDTQEDWACEARRYYFGIVGKYGAQVQSVIKKLASKKIETICSLHGPILNENLEYYINLYNIWSSYQVETEGVVISYTSIYGNTKKAVELLAEKLLENGCKKVVLNDLARCDMAEAWEDAFRYSHQVFATTTYNSDIFPFMKTFIDGLTERNYQNRTVAFIENGSWAPTATQKMKKMLENSKNLTYAENNIKILSSITKENEAQICDLAKELCK